MGRAWNLKPRQMLPINKSGLTARVEACTNVADALGWDSHNLREVFFVGNHLSFREGGDVSHIW